MNINDRLREERERLKLPQDRFAAVGGVQKRAQINYESGERMPDAGYLAAVASIGVDVLYVLTGERSGAAAMGLSAEELALVATYRAASPEVRRAALGALVGADPTATVKKVELTNHARGAIQVGVHLGPGIVRKRSS